jgi:hypothetical protein
MRRTLKRVAAVVAVAISAVTAPMTPASADTGDTLTGGCGYTGAGGDLVAPDKNQGVIYDVSLSREGNGTPSFATVECWIQVNGVKQIQTDLFVSSTGVQVGQRLIVSFDNFVGDSISLCTKVTFAASDGTPGSTNCEPLIEIQAPSQPILDLLNALQTQYVDPIICAFLYSLAPLNVANVLIIDSGGNVYVSRPGGGYFWAYDCPPYGDAPGHPLTSSAVTILTGVPPL